MAEQIKNTLNRILENTQASQKLQSKAKCKICSKEFEYNPFNTRGEWDVPECCSDPCKEKKEQQDLIKKIPMLLSRADVPPKYQNIKSDKTRLVTDIVNTKGSIYVWGNAGTGKTVFVCSVIREMFLKYGEIEQLDVSRGYGHTFGVQFISSPKLIMELQDLYGKKGGSAWDHLQKFARISVLILDDIGAEKMTDFVRQALYYLINEREQWQLQTIITSNYSLSQLDEYIDGRISSRIAGMSKIVEFKGQDRRLVK